jgi:hypothetical protein
MRQHLTAKLDREADFFDPKGGKDELRIQEYREHLEWKLDNHPDWKVSNDVIKQRLRETMLLRGRRMLFHSNRVRHEDIPIHAPQSHRDHSLPNFDIPTPVLASRVLDDDQTRDVQKVENPSTTQPKSLHSTGMSSFKPKDDRESTATSKKTKSLIGVKKTDFPKAPKVLSKPFGFMCPLCGRRQPATKCEPKFWQ